MKHLALIVAFCLYAATLAEAQIPPARSARRTAQATAAPSALSCTGASGEIDCTWSGSSSMYEVAYGPLDGVDVDTATVSSASYTLGGYDESVTTHFRVRGTSPTLTNWTAYDSGTTSGTQGLPSDEPWMETLRDYVGLFRRSDVTVSVGTAFDYQTADYAGDVEELMRLHFALRHPNDNTLPDDLPSDTTAANYLLTTIDQDGSNTRYWRNWPEWAWWLSFDSPGNVYHADSNIKRRIVAHASVEAVMARKNCIDNCAGIATTSLANYFTRLMLAYRHASDVMPQAVRDSFAVGALKLFEELETRGEPKSQNENIDWHALWGYWLTADELGSSSLAGGNLANRAYNLARTWLFGSSAARADSIVDEGNALYRTYGCIPETNGPETTYCGLGMKHAGHVVYEAALLDSTRWRDLVLTPLLAYHRFRMLQTHEENSYYGGPSAYAARTSNDAHNMQGSDYHTGWATAIAAYDAGTSDSANYALPYVGTYDSFVQARDGTQRYGIYNEGEMDATCEAKDGNVNTTLNYNVAQNLTLHTWQDSPAQTETSVYQWPPSAWNSLSEIKPDAGTHAWIWNLHNTSSTWLRPLSERTYPWNVALTSGIDGAAADYEFWSYKDTAGVDFGWFAETISEDPFGYEDRWMLGGAIESWWSENGILLLSRSRGTDTNPTDSALTFPKLHIFGWRGNGTDSVFTSARVEDITRNYANYDAATPSISITGAVGSAATSPDPDPDGILTADLNYTITLTKLSDGLEFDYDLTHSAGDSAEILALSLPVFLRDTGQSGLSDKTIEYHDGSWSTLTTSWTSGVTKLRIGQNYGAGVVYNYVVIDATDHPSGISVRLSDQVWTQTSKVNTRVRPVYLSFTSSPGTLSPIASSVGLRFALRTSDG